MAAAMRALMETYRMRMLFNK